LGCTSNYISAADDGEFPSTGLFFVSLFKLSSCQNESHPFYYQVTGQMFIYFIIIQNKSEVVRTETLSGVDTVQCISEASSCCSHVNNCRTRNIQAVILSHLVQMKVMLLY